MIFYTETLGGFLIAVRFCCISLIMWNFLPNGKDLICGDRVRFPYFDFQSNQGFSPVESRFKCLNPRPRLKAMPLYKYAFTIRGLYSCASFILIVVIMQLSSIYIYTQNKQERKKVREVGILKKDPETLMDQISKLEAMSKSFTRIFY